MDSALVLRLSEPADFDKWFELYEEVAAEGLWIGAEVPVDRAPREEGFARFISSDAAVMFLAELDGVLVGNINAQVKGGVADIGMMVRTGHRGSGIGSALMDACVSWCQSHEVHKVTLTVWPHNTRARGLYRKFGFAEEGRLVRQYRRHTGELWDAIVMGRVLDEVSPGSPHPDDGLVS